MMKNDKETLCKKEYVPPVLMAIFIEMECGIAANSATLNPGDINTPPTPGVGDWSDGGNTGNGDYDF